MMLQRAIGGWMLLGTLWLPAAARAQEPPAHLASAAIHYQARQQLDKGVTLAQLSSGLTVLVQENHAAPVATVRCYVRNTGSAYEGEFQGAGLSHLLEHLVAGGSTSRRSEAEIQRLLDSLGGRTNAFTSTELTAFYIDCPAGQVELAMELIAENMQYAVIPAAEFQREMGVVQRELEMGQADRDRMLHQALKLLLYTRSPMRLPTIGFLPVVQQVTREQVLEFYKHRYVPQNMVFTVVGDVETQQVLDRTLELFRDFQRTTERDAVLADEPPQATARSSRSEMEGETTDFSLAWPTVPLQHPDLYPLDVASYLLASGDSARINRRLKIDQPLAISVSSSSYTPDFVQGWFDVTLSCRPEQVARCQEVVLEEVERLKHELVDPRELAKVKRQKSAEHVFGQQTVQAQADALARSYLATGDPLFDNHYVDGIQQVTAEQVRAAARRYFRPERLNAAYIDPPGAAPETGRIVAAPVESPVQRTQLKNGMTVLLKRHAMLPTVSIQAFVQGGVLSDAPQTRGRAALTTQLMTRGTEKYTGPQIAEYFDSIGGVLAMDSQRNTSYLQCSILRDDLGSALDYVHQVLFRPRLAEDEFAKVQAQQLDRIAARKADPQSEILDFWAAQLPDADPFSRTVLGTAETVAALTAADCRAYHQGHFVPQNMVLAVFGDIDPERMLARIEEQFGKEPRAGDFQLPAVPPREPLRATRRARLDSGRDQSAMVLLGYPTVRVDDERTRAALDLFNAVLTGGGGSGGRLFDELRGQRLVYYVFGVELTGRSPGYFLFLAQTRPETVQEVITRIEANIARIGREGVTDAELQMARQKLSAQHAMQNTTPASQGFQAAIDELYGLGYDDSQTYDARIGAVTVDDLKQLVARYFQHSVTVTSEPAPPPAGNLPAGRNPARREQ